MSQNKETAILGGGCFWCTEAVFSRLKGVISVKPGYAGGHVVDPSYEQVCTGKTGHAEVIKVEFDPQLISYEDLLEVFWQTHDPTTLNQQGADTGTQYRSIILYTNEEQKRLAEEKKKQLEGEKIFDRPVVTEIKSLDKFYPAEAYHERYYERNPDAGYCRVVINPKLAKLKAKFLRLTKAE